MALSSLAGLAVYSHVVGSSQPRPALGPPLLPAKLLATPNFPKVKLQLSCSSHSICTFDRGKVFRHFAVEHKRIACSIETNRTSCLWLSLSVFGHALIDLLVMDVDKHFMHDKKHRPSNNL